MNRLIRIAFAGIVLALGLVSQSASALPACSFGHCTTYNALQRCRRVCNRTTGGSECAVQPGTTCVGFTTPLVIGGTEYGVCAP